MGPRIAQCFTLFVVLWLRQTSKKCWSTLLVFLFKTWKWFHIGEEWWEYLLSQPELEALHSINIQLSCGFIGQLKTCYGGFCLFEFCFVLYIKHMVSEFLSLPLSLCSCSWIFEISLFHLKLIIVHQVLSVDCYANMGIGGKRCFFPFWGLGFSFLAHAFREKVCPHEFN